MWNFVEVSRTALLRQWICTADEIDDEHIFLNGRARLNDTRFLATAEAGIMRSMNANALLEGELEILYEGWPRMTMGPGFDVSNEHTNLWQSGPVAPMHAKVLVAPVVWWCAKARKQDEFLDVAFEQGRANDPFSFVPVSRPTYIIPVIGSTDRLARYEVGLHTEATTITGTFSEDGVVAFIWKR